MAGFVTRTKTRAAYDKVDVSHSRAPRDLHANTPRPRPPLDSLSGHCRGKSAGPAHFTAADTGQGHPARAVAVHPGRAPGHAHLQRAIQLPRAAKIFRPSGLR